MQLLRAALAILVCSASWAAAARAEPMAFPSYPAKADPASARAWLAQSTTMGDLSTALVAEGAAFTLSPSGVADTRSGPVTRQLREEVLDAAVAAKLGGRSSTATVVFDCTHSNYALHDAVVYPGNSLLGGDGRAVSPAKWLDASVIYLYELATLVCPMPTSAAQAPSPLEPRPQTMPATASHASTSTPLQAAPLKTSTKPAPRAGLALWVQAGAYPNRQAAEHQWTALKSKTTGLGRQFEPAPGAGLVRLLIGPFATEPEAMAACKRFEAQSVECFVRRRPPS